MRINYIFHKKIVTCVTRAKVTIYNFISGILLQSLVPRHRFLNLSIRPIKTECRVQKCWDDHFRFLHPSLSSECLNILSRFKTLWTCFACVELCRITLWSARHNFFLDRNSLWLLDMGTSQYFSWKLNYLVF